MTTFGILVHKDWCCRIFQHLGPCLLAGIFQSLFGIIYDEFLAKGIDKRLGASRDNKLIWIGGSEPHRVANHIAPQATRRRDEHGVVLVLLHTP